MADLFARSRRCGVYVLKFTGGDLYVGQATDVTRRFAQHRVTYDDIEAISFRCLPKKRLSEVEQQTVYELERAQHRLRNVIFASMPAGESDFDLTIPRQEQDAWLAPTAQSDLSGTRVVDPALRRRFHRRYVRLLQLQGADRVIEVARRYAQTCLPVPLRTEVSFWSCSCLPSGYTVFDDEFIYVRFNVNWQVTLTLSDFDGELVGSFHLARSPLEKVFGRKLDGLKRRVPSVVELPNLLRAGGQDQVNLYVRDRHLERFLAEPVVLSAIRQFNVRLMRKGPCAYSRYHCLALADRLLTN